MPAEGGREEGRRWKGGGGRERGADGRGRVRGAPALTWPTARRWGVAAAEDGQTPHAFLHRWGDRVEEREGGEKRVGVGPIKNSCTVKQVALGHI